MSVRRWMLPGAKLICLLTEEPGVLLVRQLRCSQLLRLLCLELGVLLLLLLTQELGVLVVLL